jgi:hypothetical protein
VDSLFDLDVNLGFDLVLDLDLDRKPESKAFATQASPAFWRGTFVDRDNKYPKALFKGEPNRCIGRSIIQGRQESIGRFDGEVRYRNWPRDTISQTGEYGSSQITGPDRWFP